MKLVDRKTESTVALPHAQEMEEESGEKFVMPTNFNMHAMSHRETYIEKKLKVQRPRLTHTRLDPDYYLTGRYKASMTNSA